MMTAPSTHGLTAERVTEYARAYAALGWPVLPVEAGGKLPAGRLAPHGVKSATCDAARVDQWFGAELLNIGLACGKSAGFIVVDVDPRNGGDDTLAQIEARYGALPDTLTQRTGGGGRHLFFRWSERVRRGKLGAGVDIKKDGGYIVAEPSRTSGAYAFVDWEVFDACDPPIAEAPDWLLDLLDERTASLAQDDRAPVKGRILPAREIARIRTMLGYCSGFDEYDTWVQAGMALHHETGGSAQGFDLWAEWGRRSAKYVEAQHREKWQTFARGEGARVTLATLAHIARGNGWRDEPGEAWGDLALPGAIRTPNIPADLLPGLLGQMAGAVARSTQTPEAASVMMLLSVLATVLQRRYEVAPHGDDYRETLSLWLLVALPSGARKSAVIGALADPLHRWEKLERDRLRVEIARTNSLRIVAKKRIESLTQQAAKAPDAQERERLRKEIEDEELAMPDELRAPRLVTGDVTPERLQSLIAEQGERMAVMSDEAGIFQVLAGQYSGGMANIDAFLQGYSGSPFRVDRAGREAHVDRPALSFGLMLQPGVLAEVASVRRFRDSGLLARFQFVLPESLVGKRDVRARVGIAPELRAQWEALVFALLPRAESNQASKPAVLDLSDEARELWLTFAERIERNQGDGGKFEAIADWTAKLPGAVARIAALLELAVTRGEARTVGADSMRRAVRLGVLLVPHAEAAFRLLGADAVEADAAALLRWIQANRFDRFKRSEAQKAMEGRFRTVKRLEDAAARLAEWGVLSPVRMSKNPGARATPYYNVNPALFDDSSNSP
ncbi:MAG TPA: DUF3987 domain-containing protein [Rhodocyclaceae bacterium]|nr:DUF3987 domain-containing protein [Rhodocyclaceae bacterium]HNC61701.1 DUF3987 domain-containing protein [Rhodocyclaceae bacterium]HNH12545.1 DUF3987 domain-containing protein [Rhodocyclaceae bacterium]HNI00273.1 DUF3987 domain-containing protein [Rhodocyclaceae bacterium]